MKIFIIGITGLLGSETARCLFRDGHEISGLSLASIPSDFELPPQIQIHIKDYLTISTKEFKTLVTGFDALIFAAGIDERIKTPPPAYEIFNKYNVDPLRKLIPVAKDVGVKHLVVFGSYFTHFNEIRPKLELAKHHPYIKSRQLQKEMVLSFGDENFDVSLLELPYIFGTQKGRKPVWTFLIKILLKMKGFTYYPAGGSAMVTVKQVGEAAKGALFETKGAKAYPISYYNTSWKEMLTVMHRAISKPKRKIIVVPYFIYKIIMKHIYRIDQMNGYEGGLNLEKFAAMHCSYQYIDPATTISLGVGPDDLEAAIYESSKLSYDIIKNNNPVIEMKITK